MCKSMPVCCRDIMLISKFIVLSFWNGSWYVDYRVSFLLFYRQLKCLFRSTLHRTSTHARLYPLALTWDTTQYSTEGKIKEPNLAAEAGQGLKSAVSSYARGDMGGVFSSVTGLIKTASGNSQRAEQFARATKTSPADVVSFYSQFLCR